ncbi:MAG TPA: penicillin-binding protein activator [Hyphomicrobiaceae bacterium]|nr:penicillin-binding protein activator [Hyphomicrobiaceae bacterium]
MRFCAAARASLWVVRNLLTPVLAGMAIAGCALTGGPLSGLTTGALTDEEGQSGTGKRAGVKVALLLPLTAPGQTAFIAKAMKQAGELAMFEHDNPSFQLLVKDDKGTPDGARAAAEQAVKEGAELILGPLLAPSVKAVAPIARQANIPVIAFSNDRHVAGQGVYLLSFLVEQEVERIVAYAVAQGRRRFAALIPEDSYGQLTQSAFVAAVSKHQGTVVAIERYHARVNGLLEPTKRLVEAMQQAEAEGGPVDAVFLPGGPETLPNVGPLIAYNQIDTRRIKLIGSGGWDYANLGRDAAFVGGWFPAPDPQGWRAFAERFAKTYGGTAPPRIASLAYDAVSIAIGLSKGPRGSRFTTENLTRASGFTGIDGPVRLLPDGTAERGLAVLEVQSFGARVVDPPAAVFGAAQFSAASPRLN